MSNRDIVSRKVDTDRAVKREKSKKQECMPDVSTAASRQTDTQALSAVP